MLVPPVNTTQQTVTRTKPVSWETVAKRAGIAKANDNPAFAVTEQVPTKKMVGQFIDIFS